MIARRRIDTLARMNGRSIVRSLLLAGLALVACGRTYHAPVSAVQSRLPLTLRHEVLSNGLEVYLQEDHAAPIIALSVWYHVGSRDDPPGRSGLAHLFEHLMFDGSKHLGGRWHPVMEGAGATDVNGSTDFDRTEYHEVVPSSKLEFALWAESDRMGFELETLNDAALQRSRDVVKNERREHYEDVPYALVPSMARAALFPADHPYHHSTIGEPAELDAVTTQEMTAFFSRYYVPDDATLVLVGDFRADEALAMIRSYFEPIPRGAKPLERWPRMPYTPTKETTLTVEASVDRPALYYAWAAPACCGPETTAIDTATSFVEGNLYDELATSDTELVDATKSAGRVRMRYDAFELAGVVSLYVNLQKNAEPAAARKTADEAMARLSARRFGRNGVLRVSFEFAADLVFDLERFRTRAESFNHFAQYTGDPTYSTKLIGAFEVMDSEDVRTSFRDWLVQSDGVVVYVVPTKGAPRGGRLK
jgi:zinc protease